MKLELRVIDDTGATVAYAQGEAFRPLQWKSNPENPLVIPTEPGRPDSSHYKVWSYLVTPIVTKHLRPTK